MNKTPKTRVRALALLLTCCLLFPVALAACADTGPVVMTYRRTDLPAAVYRYWLACYRAQYSSIETEENRARLAEIATANAERSLIAAGLYDAYGLRLDTSVRDTIRAAMERMEENAGGREALETELSRFGMTRQDLETAVTMEQKGAALQQYLFGTYGVYTVQEEEKEAFYQETYARVYMIYVSYVDYLTDAEGNRVIDPATGYYQYSEKTGAARAEAEAKVAALTAATAYTLTSEAFLELGEMYNEDPSAETYPNGYYFAAHEDYRAYIPEIPQTALSMEVGTTALVESAYGMHFLLRVEADAGAYDQTANRDFFATFESEVEKRAFTYLITAELPNVTVYADVKNTIRYEDIEPNFSIYWG